MVHGRVTAGLWWLREWLGRRAASTGPATPGWLVDGGAARVLCCPSHRSSGLGHCVTGQGRTVSPGRVGLCHWVGSECVTGKGRTVSPGRVGLCHRVESDCVTGQGRTVSPGRVGLCHRVESECVTGQGRTVSPGRVGLCHRVESDCVTG